MFFSNVLEIHDYLKSKYRISQSGLYKHQKEGKFRPESDGTYPQEAIDAYAKMHLRRLDGQTEVLDDLSRVKLESEIAKNLAQARHWELKVEEKRGDLIEKAEIERLLAMRAAFLRADLENFFRITAPDIVKTVDGNHDLVPALIDFGLKRLEMWIARYSEPMDLRKKSV